MIQKLTRLNIIHSNLITYSSLKVKKKNIGKTNLKVLYALLNKLFLCQWALRLGYIGKNQLITTTQRVYYEVSELEFMLFILVITLEKLSFKLWSFIMRHNNRNTANIQYFTNYWFGWNNCNDQYNKGNNTHNHWNNNKNGHKL